MICFSAAELIPDKMQKQILHAAFIVHENRIAVLDVVCNADGRQGMETFAKIRDVPLPDIMADVVDLHCLGW